MPSPLPERRVGQRQHDDAPVVRLVRRIRIPPQPDDVRIHAAARDRLAELVDDQQIEVVERNVREVLFRRRQQTHVGLEKCVVGRRHDLDGARLPVSVLDDRDAAQDLALSPAAASARRAPTPTVHGCAPGARRPACRDRWCTSSAGRKRARRPIRDASSSVPRTMMPSASNASRSTCATAPFSHAPSSRVSIVARIGAPTRSLGDAEPAQNLGLPFGGRAAMAAHRRNDERRAAADLHRVARCPTASSTNPPMPRLPAVIAMRCPGCTVPMQSGRHQLGCERRAATSSM